ncbi:cob(I)yrinic acid a,c-diamide adenosyltransferase [Lactobacillus helveticus]|uniref:cob(I)yrinic acid a,c-diamide adenosyltransferase n=2 Tax=Lactobacillus helveticus TaxID=1587 RepID=UPI00062AA720|nr:cob(I)yrinic acid a,c-diamide adenosyltransferase [Lactobacillus helveticus]AKG65948.1 ATP:cob(I)alamin adenosyltransferase [Lactobacillus helveticus]NRO16641.1 Cob(I)yrinic acid a,c-diamide adenosyltransferase [Lactobacillus helveticus]
MLKIYTKVGDQGFTKQVTGKMVPKCDLQLEALGNVDELQSYLGVTIANLSPNCEELKPELENIQRQLYQLQADIVVKRHNEINSEMINALEKRINELTPKIPTIPEFILPGGKATGANLQYARTLARRTERSLVNLNLNEQKLSENILKYINRLSDYLFILGRYANILDNYTEVKSKKHDPNRING